MIILDTNFILTCVKQKIDLFSQIREIFPEEEAVIPDVVIRELEMLAKRQELTFAERNAADLSLQLIKKENAKITKSEGKADNFIVRYALKNKVIVASLDRGIRARLRDKAEFLTIRQGKRIARL